MTTRRALLLGTGAVAALAALPIALGGTTSFLRRVLSDHFGSDVLDIDGIDDFVSEYAALAGADSAAKKLGAEVYFAWRGDMVHKIGAAQALEHRFLQTILTRSNIIAMRQGTSSQFEFTSVDPWEPTCGLYLSALGEETV
ncbi:MAG: hypothetical protein AAFQ51_08350 [Pseudomonadota bacterium]